MDIRQINRCIKLQALHGLRLDLFQHLYAVHQRGAAPNRRGYMHGLGHLLEVRSLAETLVRVGVNTIGALYGMSHGQRDQRLFRAP